MKLTAERKQEIFRQLLDLITAEPDTSFKALAEKTGRSRQSVSKYIAELLKQNLITKQDKRYLPAVQAHTYTHAVPEVKSEDALYIAEIAPLVKNLPQNIRDAVSYGFSEIVNNALDHSGGTQLRYTFADSANFIELTVEDDGIGIFNKIKQDMALDDVHFAILELAKGKFTSDPARHSGEGIFFTSRIFDEFAISSGTLRFVSAQGSDMLSDTADEVSGTVIRMKMLKSTTRTAREVFDFYAATDRVPSFYKTKIPLKLMEYEGMKLISRSQAKRLYARFERFREVILDFDGVEEIGQGFADELFRVFRNAHPETELVPLHCTAAVLSMIQHVQTA